tara:strand:+ start:171 stop:548 length:378 start_codon:yes stop_codon:yes gene_type:complete
MAVQTISKDELNEKLQSGEAIQVVNVLEPEWYKLGLIVGSKKIPLSELENRFGELDKSKEVVAYCANAQCSASSEAAKKLAEAGFNVKAYEGGIKEWRAAGLPTEETGSTCGSSEASSKGSSCCG